MNPEKNNLQKHAIEIFYQGIDACLPSNCLTSFLDQNYNSREKILNSYLSQNLDIVAIGKAGFQLASAFQKYMIQYCSEKNISIPKNRGIVLTKHGHSTGEIDGFHILESSHPYPGQDSLESGKALVDFISSSQSEQILFLISGGGSSLIEHLLDGETLENLHKLNKDLVQSGKDIQTINKIRKSMSQIKGGKLLNFIPEQVKSITNLYISDVIGDDLSSISSGMSFPSEDTSLNNSSLIIKNHIIGNLSRSLTQSKAKAESLGYKTTILTSSLQGEAKEVAKVLASFLREMQTDIPSFPKPTCLLLGGETTVQIKGSGLGGRNQELAYAFALEVQGRSGLCFLSGGTDGTDGPTDAAGGIVDGDTITELSKITLESPESFLEDNNSYPALEMAGSLLMTGPTGTNINDILVLLVE